jgi:hypothetical protein
MFLSLRQLISEKLTQKLTFEYLILLLLLLPGRHHHAFHKNWIQLGPEDADFSSFACVDNGLATCGFSSITGLCDDCVGGGSSEEEEGGDEHDLEPVPVFA